MTEPTLVQILNIPIAAPGTCVICGSPGDDKRKFIDFNLTIDYFGVVYFCTFCFSEIANACNFIENSGYQSLLQRNQELKGALESANTRIESLNATLRDCFNGNSPVDTLRDVPNSHGVSQASKGNNQRPDVPTADSNESFNVEDIGDILNSSDTESPTASKSSNPLEF